MKITKGKSRPSKAFQMKKTQKNSKKLILGTLPLDEELWDDWQKVVEVDHKPKETKQKKQKKKDLTNSFTPVTIHSTSTSVHIPSCLRRNFKPQGIPQRKNNILRDFITNETPEKLLAKITICRTIVPDEIRLKKRSKKLKKSTQSEPRPSTPEEHDQYDVSMILDETIDSSSQVEPSNPLETSQIPEESPLPHFYSLRDRVICVISPETSFSFQGKLKIQVLYGAIKVYGSILTKENTKTPVEVYSSRGTSQISIESTTESSTGSIPQVWEALTLDNIDQNISNDLQSHINHLEPGWAVVRLQNLENNLTGFLSRFCSHRLFPKVDDVSNYSWVDPRRAEVVLQASIHPENSIKQMIRFHRADNVFDVISRGSGENSLRILFAGGKNVGKSTTARYFVNKLLKTSRKVVFVDLDIGQAEFTPPGCISVNIVEDHLLGPNFTHLRTPVFQLFVGGVDATKHLMNYVEGVRKLSEFLDGFEGIEGVPVVVNTMGFCKGMGGDIMGHVVRSFRPTDVVQIISKRVKNNFEQLLTCEVVNRQTPTWKNWSSPPEPQLPPLNYQLHAMDTEAETRNPSAEVWNIEPHQQREIVMLAYLSDIVKPKKKKGVKQDFTTINEVVPYQVPFSAVRVSLGKPLVPRVLSVMNGSIVALCGIDLEEELGEDRKVGYPKVLMRASSSVCYGFGILRGVDMTNEKLYINTPLSPPDLKHVNCLIGSMPVPSGLLQLNSSSLPYAGDEGDLPTSRDPRRGYFRVNKHRHDN